MSILSTCKMFNLRQLTQVLRGIVVLHGVTLYLENVKLFLSRSGGCFWNYVCYFLFSFMLSCFFLFSLDFCIRDTASSLSFVLRYGFLGPTLRTVSPAQYQRKAFSQKITNDVMLTLFCSGLWQ